ncbi:MAG: toll/interleukin-1 receptor domain-containing protein, partial [Hymenobacter sp.]
MIRFEPNSIDYTPANRLQIDFLGAEQILVESSFLMADGQQATVPFDFYVLLHFNAGYSTIAVFPHAELSEEKELVLLDYCIKVIAKKLTDRKLGVDLLANKNSFTHAPNRLGFNKSIYIYKPTVAIRRELIFTFFEERDTRARLRDLIYYQQQWEARRPDIFISHDSSDKASVAEPLYHALVARGLKVWLDKYTLRLGDSLTQKINEGIAECRYGILILSKAFLANERWAKRELSGFSVKEIIEGNNRLIPIWHGIGEDDLRVTNNDWLIDKLGGNTNDGIEALADRIVTDIAEFVSVVPKTQPKQNNLLDSEIINKGQVTPQSSTRKVIIQDIVLKTWKDPVWSKVIAAAILALVGSIWAIIYQYENTTSTSDATPQNISESTQYA